MTFHDGQSDVDRVRDATDLVALIGAHVALKPKGREHVGLCPFHEDRSPSMTVVTHKAQSFYKCHACGASGDAFSFVMEYLRMDFREALTYLADRAGIELAPRTGGGRPKQQSGPGRHDLIEANGFAAEFFAQALRGTAGDRGRAVMAERMIDDATAATFGIGLAPDGWGALLDAATARGVAPAALEAAGLIRARQGGGHYDTFRDRLIFPICDDLGRPVAFGGRRLGPSDDPRNPKYLNSPESAVFNKSRVLYGLHLAKQSIIAKRQVIVTEGYTDVVACHRAGFDNVVATLGTALTGEHATLLSRLCDTVVLVFDPDEAGKSAADRALESFARGRVDIKICLLPDGLDPDDLLRTPDGAERFAMAIDDATDALEFKVRRFRDALASIESPSGRERRLEEFLGELSAIGFGALQGVRRHRVIVQLADLLHVPSSVIDAALRRQPKRPVSRAPEPMHDAPPPVEATYDDVPRRRRLAERDLLSILLSSPELAHEPVVSPDGEACTVITYLTPDRFHDGTQRTLWCAMTTTIDAQGSVTVQDLLARLDDTAARNLAGTLFFEGEHHLDEDRTPADRLHAAVAALDACDERDAHDQTLESWRSAPSNDPNEAAKRIASLNTQRYNPSAIPRGVRS